MVQVAHDWPEREEYDSSLRPPRESYPIGDRHPHACQEANRREARLKPEPDHRGVHGLHRRERVERDREHRRVRELVLVPNIHARSQIDDLVMPAHEGAPVVFGLGLVDGGGTDHRHQERDPHGAITVAAWVLRWFRGGVRHGSLLPWRRSQAEGGPRGCSDNLLSIGREGTRCPAQLRTGPAPASAQ